MTAAGCSEFSIGKIKIRRKHIFSESLRKKAAQQKLAAATLQSRL